VPRGAAQRRAVSRNAARVRQRIRRERERGTAMSVTVSRSVRPHAYRISETARPNFAKFSVLVACDCDSVLRRLQYVIYFRFCYSNIETML